MIGCPLWQKFDLVFGTSTGAIIASLIALGYSVDDIHGLYRDNVPKIMRRWTSGGRSAALNELAMTVFGNAKFDAVKTGVGIVATRWVTEKPMIFKNDIAQAQGRVATFVPGFGCTIAEAVQASCSAYPFFKRTTVTTSTDDKVELLDGGYCANNPTLYAIADAVVALKRAHADIRIVSVGVGVYPAKKRSPLMRLLMRVPFIWMLAQLLQKTLEINTQSMEQLRSILFKDIRTIRINDAFEKPEMATDLLEHDLNKLNLLRQRGRESFAAHEAALKDLLA